MTKKEKIIRKHLVELPFVETNKSRFTSSEAFYINGREFAHFHDDETLDLRLTRDAIGRLRMTAGSFSNLKFRKCASDWVVVNVERSTTVQSIKLISEAYCNNRWSYKKGSK